MSASTARSSRSRALNAVSTAQSSSRVRRFPALAKGRLPPFHDRWADAAFPASVVGPVAFNHGFTRRAVSLAFARRSSVQAPGMSDPENLEWQIFAEVQAQRHPPPPHGV